MATQVKVIATARGFDQANVLREVGEEFLAPVGADGKPVTEATWFEPADKSERTRRTAAPPKEVANGHPHEPIDPREIPAAGFTGRKDNPVPPADRN